MPPPREALADHLSSLHTSISGSCNRFHPPFPPPPPPSLQSGQERMLFGKGIVVPGVRDENGDQQWVAYSVPAAKPERTSLWSSGTGPSGEDLQGRRRGPGLRIRQLPPLSPSVCLVPGTSSVLHFALFWVSFSNSCWPRTQCNPPTSALLNVISQAPGILLCGHVPSASSQDSAAVPYAFSLGGACSQKTPRKPPGQF